MASRDPRSGSLRRNEYFLPGDGIDREVITTDICRYLGNDALVRTGVFQDPTTAKVLPGYFITSYRNLTAAMITDLKADSKSWSTEREKQKSQSKGSNDLVSGFSDPSVQTILRANDYGRTLVSQSHGENLYTYDSSSKSFSDPFYGSGPLLGKIHSQYQGETSMSTIRTPHTLSAGREGTRSGTDSTSLRSPEVTKILASREQSTFNTYGDPTQLLQTAGRSMVADSVTRAGIITAGTVGTFSTIGISSNYYTSQKANAQNEAKFAWEREQANRRERLDERESAMERQEQSLRERESAFESRERTLQVELREIETQLRNREDGIRRKENELKEINQKYGDWGKNLSKIQAETVKSENEMKERSEELRKTDKKLREREDEMNRTERMHVERGKDLDKIEAGIKRSEDELRQRSEKLREREEEWKRQQQQCNCRRRASEPNSSTSPGPDTASQDEPPKPYSSKAPLKMTKCSTLPPADVSQTDSSPCLADVGFDANQQSISFPTNMASQPSTVETKTSSQIVTMNTCDTESAASTAAPVPSDPDLSQLTAQFSTNTKLDILTRSPSEGVKEPPSHLGFTSHNSQASGEVAKKDSDGFKERLLLLRKK